MGPRASAATVNDRLCRSTAALVSLTWRWMSVRRSSAGNNSTSLEHTGSTPCRNGDTSYEPSVPSMTVSMWHSTHLLHCLRQEPQTVQTMQGRLQGCVLFGGRLACAFPSKNRRWPLRVSAPTPVLLPAPTTRSHKLWQGCCKPQNATHNSLAKTWRSRSWRHTFSKLPTFWRQPPHCVGRGKALPSSVDEMREACCVPVVQHRRSNRINPRAVVWMPIA